MVRVCRVYGIRLLGLRMKLKGQCVGVFGLRVEGLRFSPEIPILLN